MSQDQNTAAQFEIPPRSDGPPDPQHPPWGASIIPEYFQTLETWRELDAEDRPGLSLNKREQIAAKKMAAYDLRNIIRARGVNEFLTFLRWAAEDAPGALAEILREIVQHLTQPELEELADAIIRLERRGGGR